MTGFDSCGSNGGDWCLWWINDLTMRGKGRRRCLWREVIWPWGNEGVYRERKKKEVEEGQRLVWVSEKWDKNKEKRISTKEKIKRLGQNKNIK